MINKSKSSWVGWMAVAPKSLQPWGRPWVYLYKRKPREIEYSGYKAIRVKIIKTEDK